MNIRYILVIALFSLIFILNSTAFGAGYNITTDTLSGGGIVNSNSARYNMNDIMGQKLSIGISTSLHYNLSAGRYKYLDIEAPPPPVITTNGGEDFTQKFLVVTLEGTCDTSTYSIYINGLGTGVFYIPGSISWSYTGTLSGGNNLFSVTALDICGNESTTDTIIVTLDVEADDDADDLPTYWEDQYGLDWEDGTGDDGPSGDPDNDGQTNNQEYLADTDPRNGISIFIVSDIQESGSGITMQFLTSSRRNYEIYYTNESYSDSITWTLAETVSGTGSLYSWTDDGSHTGVSPLGPDIAHRYYKITPVFASGWGTPAQQEEDEDDGGGGEDDGGDDGGGDGDGSGGGDGGENGGAEDYTPSASIGSSLAATQTSSVATTTTGSEEEEETRRYWGPAAMVILDGSGKRREKEEEETDKKEKGEGVTSESENHIRTYIGSEYRRGGSGESVSSPPLPPITDLPPVRSSDFESGSRISQESGLIMSPIDKKTVPPLPSVQRLERIQEKRINEGEFKYHKLLIGLFKKIINTASRFIKHLIARTDILANSQIL